MYMFDENKNKVDVKVVETPIGTVTAGGSIYWNMTAQDLAQQGVDDITKYMILAVNDVIPALEGDEYAGYNPSSRTISGENYCYPTIQVSIEYSEQKLIGFFENSGSETAVVKLRIVLLEIR